MRYAERKHVVPVLAPVDIVATATFTKAAHLNNYRWVTFFVQLGVVTDTVGVISVLESTSSATTSALAIPFSYRLSSAAGTDAIGASTSCDSSGVTYAADADGKMYVIDVDPAALTDGYEWVRVLITPASAGSSVCLVSAVAVLEPRYPGATPISSS